MSDSPSPSDLHVLHLQLVQSLAQDEAANAEMTHELSVMKEQICKTLATLRDREEELKRRKEQIEKATKLGNRSARSPTALVRHAKDSARCFHLEQMVSECNKEIVRLTRLNEQLKQDQFNAQNRLRDEMLCKQSELENLKFKLTFSEKSEKQVRSQLEAANEKVNDLTSQLRRHQEQGQDVDQLKAYILIIERDREELTAKCRQLEDERVAQVSEKTRDSLATSKKNTELSTQVANLQRQMRELAEEKQLLIETKEKLRRPAQAPPCRPEPKTAHWLSLPMKR